MPNVRSPFSDRFTKADANALAVVLKALADRNRLRILSHLFVYGELTTTELVAHLGDLSQATVSHHLRLLAAARLVRVGRAGSHRPRTLDHGTLARVVDALLVGGEGR